MERLSPSRLLCLVIALFCWIATPLGFDGMENRYTAQAISLAKKGAFTIDPYYNLSIDIAKVEKHYYPACPPGLPLLATPVAWLSTQVYNLLPDSVTLKINDTVKGSSQFYRDQHQDLDIGHFLFTLIMLRFFFAAPMAVVLGLGMMRLFKAWKPHIDSGSSVALTLAILLGTNLAFYLPRFYAHSLTASLYVWTTLWAVESQPLTKKKAFSGGFLAGLLPLIDYPHALGALFLGLLFLKRKPQSKEVGLALLGAAIPAAIFMGYHTLIFGGPLSLAHRYIVGFENHYEGFYGLTIPTISSIGDTLFSVEHGFFIYAFLLIPALARMDRFVLALFFTFVLVESAFVTSGGDAGPIWGQRHLVPLIPLMGTALLNRYPCWLAFGGTIVNMAAAMAPFNTLFRGVWEAPILNLLQAFITGGLSFPLLELLKRFHLISGNLISWVIAASVLAFAALLSFKLDQTKRYA